MEITVAAYVIEGSLDDRRARRLVETVLKWPIMQGCTKPDVHCNQTEIPGFTALTINFGRAFPWNKLISPLIRNRRALEIGPVIAANGMTVSRLSQPQTIWQKIRRKLCPGQR